ncbi:MAG: cache domain-containing protein [Desulfobacteraceae bacterium]|nr:cache domain-containing protein [Desulfobacteraceae bacterium]
MRRFTGKGRKIVFFIVSLCGIFVFSTSGNTTDSPQKDKPAYQTKLMKTMESAIKGLEAIYTDKSLNHEKKELKAIQFAKNFKYGPGNKDRLSVTTLKQDVILNPYKPALEGKSLNDFRDPNDVSAFRRINGIATEHQEGWFISPWPRLDEKGLASRVSYVKIFEPLGWVLDVGFFIETIEAYEPPVSPGGAVFLDSIDLDGPESPASGT